MVFPEWSEDRLASEVRQTGARLGEGAVHILNAWFGKAGHRKPEELFINAEVIQQGLSNKRGLLVLVWHDVRLETVGRAFHALTPLSMVFNPSTSNLVNQITYTGRQALSHQQIPSINLRELVRALNDNHTVAYLIDQGRLGNKAIKTVMFGQDFYVDPLLPKLLRDYRARLITVSFTSGADPFPVTGHLLPEQALDGDNVQLCQALVDELAKAMRKDYRYYIWEAKLFRQPKGLPNPYNWPPES